MALAFDAASSATTGGTASTTLTWSHTCNGGNRALIVAVSFNPIFTVNSITYNGVNMTRIGGISDVSPDQGVEQWALSNPASGAHDIVATLSGTTSIVGGAVSFTGAHQLTDRLTGPQTTAKDMVGGTSFSINVPSALDEIVIDAFAINTVTTLTAGAGQTKRFDQIRDTGLSPQLVGSTEAGAGTVTMSWTAADLALWLACGVSIKPAQPVRMSSFALRNALDSDEDEGRFNELDVRNWL